MTDHRATLPVVGLLGRSMLALGIIAAVLLVAPTSAGACICTGEPAPEEYWPDVVFSGVVTERSADDFETRTTFTVREVLRGELGPEVVQVQHGVSSCGPHAFAVGEEVVRYPLWRSGDEWEYHGCSYMPEEALGPPRPPDPSIGAPDRSYLWPAMVALLGVAVGLGVGIAKRSASQRAGVDEAALRGANTGEGE